MNWSKPYGIGAQYLIIPGIINPVINLLTPNQLLTYSY